MINQAHLSPAAHLYMSKIRTASDLMSRLPKDGLQREWLDGNPSSRGKNVKTRRVPLSLAALVSACRLRRLNWTVAIRKRNRWWRRRRDAERTLQCRFHRPGSQLEWLPSISFRQCLESGYFRRSCRSELRRNH